MPDGFEIPFPELFDAAIDGIAIFEPHRDDQGRVVDFVYRYVNPVGAAITRFGVDELLGHGLAELSPEVVRTGLFDRYLAAYEGDEWLDRVEYDSDRASGTFGVRAKRVGDALVIRFRDFTDTIELEVSAEEAHARTEAILASISDAFCVLDHEWCFSFVNDEACRLLGRTRDELIGRHVWTEFPAGAGEVLQSHFARAVADEQPVSFEVHYPEPLDSWYAVRAYPGQDGLSVFFHDIGPQRLMEARLAQAQRLESIAMLAGGIAHDFNNLLTVIGGHVALLLEDSDETDPNWVDIEAIDLAVKRANDLTRQMLSFSRRQILRPKLVDVNALVQQLTPLSRRVLGDTHELVLRVAPEPVMVEVDPIEFDHVLLALVVNAADAMGDHGRLTIETSAVELTDELAAQEPEAMPGWYAVVSVSDDGVGMTPDVLGRAFEPFFSTKPSGQSSGLGLAAVHGMAHQAGGYVTIHSEPGVGTTVRVVLPLAADGRVSESRPD